MIVKLIKIIQDVDNNNHHEDRGRFSRYVDIFHQPQKNMSVEVSSNDIFYIEHITQKPHVRILFLYEYTEIIHYHKNDGTYEKIVKDLTSKGWKED